MSKERPILFSTEMVKAILAGRKTMTRRVAKDKAIQQWEDAGFLDEFIKNPENNWTEHCPYGQPGDILWVRETWGYYQPEYVEAPYFVYKADFPIIQDGIRWDEPKWKPSIHMPREACRLFLKVKSIRAERLQEITETDARAEGIREFELVASNGTTKLYGLSSAQSEMSYSAKEEFQYLWDSINDKRGYGWEVNPWVWVVEFERVHS